MSAVRSGGDVADAVVRRIREDDLPAIVRIEGASFSDPWSEASFRSMLASPLVIAGVVERAGAVLGYAIAWKVLDEAELANLAVAAEARQCGFGGMLLDHVLREIDAQGGATVHLEVRAGNVAAQALYARRGFIEQGRRAGYYRSPEEDAVVMRRGD